MKMMALIRKIQLKDKTQWQKLYRDYAKFYKVEMNKQILETVWSWLNNKKHEVSGIVYEVEGNIIALDHFRKMPRPLKGKYMCFLDDVVGARDQRGNGIGEQLIAELKKISNSNGWNLIRWLTAYDNLKAKKLYDRVAKKTSWELYEL